MVDAMRIESNVCFVVNLKIALFRNDWSISEVVVQSSGIRIYSSEFFETIINTMISLKFKRLT
jgi:hypothetical protein